MTTDWPILRLGDVCTIDKALGRHLRLPYVGLEHIGSGTGQFLGDLQPFPVKSQTFRFTADHVLYGRLRPYLNKVLTPNFDGHCSTEIFPLRASPGTSRRYLFHWLSMDSTITAIDATSSGARMPRANMNAVMNLKLPVPPLPEQRRIVAILDEAFKSVAVVKANVEAKIHAAEELFMGHLERAFQAKDDSWGAVAMGSFCEIKHGFAFSGADFSKDDRMGGPLVLTPGNFTEDGELVFNARNSTRFNGIVNKDFVFDLDDLVVVMTDLSAKMKILGKPAFVNSRGILHNQRIGRFIFKNDVLEKRFLYYFMLTDSFLTNIKKSATGTMVRHTSPSRILSNTLPLPYDRLEQLAIVRKLDQLRDHIRSLTACYRAQLQLLKELKSSIHHQAFFGRLSVASEDARLLAVL